MATRETALVVKLSVIIGFLAGLAATCWLVSISGPRELVALVGFFCAGICASTCLVISWAAIFAYLVRKMNWPPKSCVFAGLSLAVPGWLVVVLANSLHALSLGSLMLAAATFAIYICRRLAFPEMTDEQAAAPPPPITLFGK